jgi:translation elongation factor EF-Ts
MSYEEALDFVSRDDKFKGTVYAMNTLLIHKGIYTRDEFEKLFVEWVTKEVRKSASGSKKTAPVSVRSA